jgi:hypothetical protein
MNYLPFSAGMFSSRNQKDLCRNTFSTLAQFLPEIDFCQSKGKNFSRNSLFISPFVRRSQQDIDSNESDSFFTPRTVSSRKDFFKIEMDNIPTEILHS